MLTVMSAVTASAARGRRFIGDFPEAFAQPFNRLHAGMEK
jgi:hypothetical protein